MSWLTWPGSALPCVAFITAPMIAPPFPSRIRTPPGTGTSEPPASAFIDWTKKGCCSARAKIARASVLTRYHDADDAVVLDARRDDLAAAVSASARGMTRFVDEPAVRAAVARVVPDAEVRDTVLSREATANPVVEQDGRILSWACEAHNCGPHNWAIAITPDGRAVPYLA